MSQTAAYFSAFGGLWTDRTDASDELRARAAAGAIDPFEAALLAQWIAKGYAVIPKALEPGLAGALNAEIEALWADDRPDVRVTVRGHRNDEPVPLERGFMKSSGVKLLDLYHRSENARRALFAEPIRRFLELLFDEPPLLFQSLGFHRGSEQWFHQDSAYVVVDRPLELAAAWIALEDAAPGCGELCFFEGSHRLPESLFGGRHKGWQLHRDGQPAHDQWAAALPRRCRDAGLIERAFLPKQGDALVWHADLVHGGSPIADPAATRRSLVGHYCPASRRPGYEPPEGGFRRSWRGASYLSAHYK